MTLIERVRAVIEAGTLGRATAITIYPGRGEILAAGTGALVATLPGEGGRPTARKLALAVNLAPAFVALWEAVDGYIGAREALQQDRSWFAIERALAALNEAAAREVGE